MSDVNSSFEALEAPIPVVTIKTELDNTTATAGDIKSEFRNKSHSNVELSNKILAKDFLCTICHDNYTDQKCFFDHLESHYLPESPDDFQCSVCEETFEAQVDFYIHVREHYKPSLMTELGSSITGDLSVYLLWL